MEKTVKALNEKTWYRLLKVVFILSIITVIGIYNLIIYFNGVKKVDQNKTTITCLYKDKRVFTPKELGINLDRYDLKNDNFDYKEFFEGYNEYDIKAILKSCYDKDVDDVYAMQKWYELGLQEKTFIPDEEMQQVTEIEKSYLTSDKTKTLQYSIKFFDIKPVFSYTEFLTYFIIGNIIILGLFELFRRMFYYIVLGKLFPKKYEQ